MEKNSKSGSGNFLGKKMTRKEAIKKVGITALTATSLMFLTTNANGGTQSGNPVQGTATRSAKPGNRGTNGRGRN